MNLKYVLFLAVFIVSSFQAYGSAMGISPSIHEIIYTGLGSYAGEFTVFPVEPKTIRLFSNSELAEHLTVEDGQKEITKHMTGPTKMTYKIDLPENLSPGTHRIVIVAEQVLTPDEIMQFGFAGAVASVAFVIKIRVPNEGKHLETTMSTHPIDIKENDTVYFKIDMLNIGNEDLTDLETQVIIKGPDENIIAAKETNKIDILRSTEKGQLRTYWDSTGYPPGQYSTEQTLDYGGNEPAFNDLGFRIGDIFIKIVNITTDISENIAKIYIDIESNWNKRIENVYAEITIIKNKEIIEVIKTSSVDLKTFGKDTLIGFWEIKDRDPGDYSIEVTVYYYDKEAKQQMQVMLPETEKKEAEKEEPAVTLNTSILLLAAVILFVILLVNVTLWIFLTHKKPEYQDGQN